MIVISILITNCIQTSPTVNSVLMHASLTLSRPLPPDESAIPLTAPDGPVCDITSSLTRARPATLWSLAIHGLLVAGLLGFQGIGANAETPPASISVTLVSPAEAPEAQQPAAAPHAAQVPAEAKPATPVAPPALEAPPPPPQPLAEMPPAPPEPIDLPLPEAAPPPDVAALAPPPPPAPPVAEAVAPAPKLAPPPPPVKAAQKPKAPPAPPKQVTRVAASVRAAAPAPIAPVEAPPAAASAAAPTTASASAPMTNAPPAPTASSGELALLAPPIITEPKYLVSPTRNYPKLAVKMGQQGIVRLAIDIDETGKVLDSSILESSGFPLLDRQAQIDIKTAAFVPYHLNGRPIRHIAHLPMNYVLK